MQIGPSWLLRLLDVRQEQRTIMVWLKATLIAAFGIGCILACSALLIMSWATAFYVVATSIIPDANGEVVLRIGLSFAAIIYVVIFFMHFIEEDQTFQATITDFLKASIFPVYVAIGVVIATWIFL